MLNRFAALVLAIAMFAGCSAPAQSPAAKNAPAPPIGKSTVVGRVISTVTNKPLVDTMIRLAEVDRTVVKDDAIYLLNEAFSPGHRTDNDGNFVIVNVDPKEYVVIISNDLGRNAVVQKDGKAATWTTEAGKVLDVGEVRINYP